MFDANEHRMRQLRDAAEAEGLRVSAGGAILPNQSFDNSRKKTLTEVLASARGRQPQQGLPRGAVRIAIL